MGVALILTFSDNVISFSGEATEIKNSLRLLFDPVMTNSEPGAATGVNYPI